MGSVRALMPLRIAQGWAIVYNAFVDVDPIVAEGRIANEEHYQEDLLLIQQITLESGEWIVLPEGYGLDLGWYPDGDPDGSFGLALIRGKWDHILLQLHSRDRLLIRDAIESLFDLIADKVPGEKLAEELSRLLGYRPFILA